MNDILQLDYHKILKKLEPLAQVQVTNETMVHDDYDDNTKQFLKFVIGVISIAKTAEKESINNLTKKLSDLINDSNKVLVDFFSNNSLLEYYNKTLSTILKEILASVDNTNKSLTIDSIKESIVQILQSLHDSIVKDHNRVFEESYEKFKSEFSETLKQEFENKTADIKKQAENLIKQEVEKKKPFIKKEISDSINKLLYKTVPLYMKSLNNTFNENFTKYIEKNFSDKAKQIVVANRLKKTFNAVLAPFAFASKTVKAIKNGTMSVGTKVKEKITNKILKPISTLVGNVKEGITKKYNAAKETFLKKTEFIRKPITVFKNWKTSVKDKLDSSGMTDIFKKYGIFGVMVKAIHDAIKKKSLKFLILSQMNFKPFKFKSVLSNTIDDFISSIEEHVGIIHGNLKLYFDKNVVEGYDVRKKKKLMTVSKTDKKVEEEGDDGGFSWMDFLLMIPALIKLVRRIWKLLKQLGKFLWKAAKFIFRVSRTLVKGVARVLGRALEKLGFKIGTQMVKWGKTTVTTAKAARNAKTAKSVYNTAKTAKALKAAKAGRDAYRTMRAAGASVRTARLAANASSMAARVNPWTVVLAFGMDAAFSAYEAQDDEYMHSIFGWDREITKQERTSYIIAGTLLGNRSLFDANWSSPGDVLMVAGETLSTVAKWAGAGALIGGIIGLGPIGGGIGLVVGAVAGLVFSLIGTERIAKAINWVCDAGKAIGRGFIYVFGGEMFKDIGEGIAKFGKWVGNKIENAWNATKTWCQGVANGIEAMSKSIQDAFDSVINSVLDIGFDIGKSLFSIGKSLLSSIFPLSPIGIAGKAIKAVANKIKDFFFSDDEKDKKIQQLQQKINTINQVNNTSYVNAIKNKLNQHIIISQDLKEENEISPTAVTDVSEIMSLTEMIHKMLKSIPKEKPIPIPVEEEDEESMATSAAEHWATQPETT